MKLAVVSESPRWSGTPLFQVEDPKLFYAKYSDWVSRFLVINELFMLQPFVELLEKDGYSVHFAESAKELKDNYDRWSQPLHIRDYHLYLPNGREAALFPYQQFTLNRALERACGRARGDRLFFFGWAAGAGKSAVSAAGAQELFNRGHIDLVLSFTLKTLRRSVFDFYTRTTPLDTELVEGTAQKRASIYQGAQDVLVLNYEKAHFDQDELAKLVAGKRVLFVLDEVQRILTDQTRTLARRGMDKLIKGCDSIVWPMSATVVSQTPVRYRDVFNLSGAATNPLGTRKEFENAYLESKRTVYIPTKYGREFPVTYFTWDLPALHDVRHRVADRTQSVRKTDPGVRENFKGLQVEPISLELSSQDRRLYKLIQERAAEDAERGVSIEPYLRLLRYVCNTPESLCHSRSELAQEFVENHSSMINSKNSAKMENLIEQVTAMRDSGDKVVVFTQWTHLSLKLIAAQLRKHKIKFVEHYGSGMTDKERDKAVADFKTDPDITVFLSSDAGAAGLSFQMARYVINYDVPFSYDLLTQRNNRIDRADSYLDGLTSYCYIVRDSVEERIWDVLQGRRALAGATLGTNEVLSYTPEDLSYLIFG